MPAGSEARGPEGRGATQQLDAQLSEVAPVLDALAEAVTIRGADNHIVYANKAALARMGLTMLEQVQEADPRELMQPYETVTEDGRPVRLDDLPSVRLLRGEAPEPLTMRTVHRLTGAEHWVVLKATALRDAAGAARAAVTIIEDVTTAKRAATRMEFLARAGQVLASSLDYQQTLRNVASLAVPQIADWCGVDLFDAEGGREPVAVAHVDPAKVQMAERLRAYQPERLDPEVGLGKVMRTGEPELITEIPDELLAAAAVDDEHLRLLRDVGMRSALIVPMRALGATMGAITMVNAESGRRFSRDDVEFAGQIADRAALAVENARLYTQRARVARTLQSGLLPDALPALPGWEVAALYNPAAPDSDVGGDFYDLWQVGEDWLVMIGDVTGKGAEAASLTSLVRHTAWEASELSSEPSYVLRRIDAALKRRYSLAPCTALCVRLSGAQGTIAAGGHPLPLRLTGEAIETIGDPGSMLGALPAPQWPQRDFALNGGETLVAFTDGVTDTVGSAAERFGADRLCEVLGSCHGERPERVCERVIDALASFQVGTQADDTAMVIMRYTGTDAKQPPDAATTPAAAGH
jgi:PAS domain S-box-containing protein